MRSTHLPAWRWGQSSLRLLAMLWLWRRYVLLTFLLWWIEIVFLQYLMVCDIMNMSSCLFVILLSRSCLLTSLVYIFSSTSLPCSTSTPYIFSTTRYTRSTFTQQLHTLRYILHSNVSYTLLSSSLNIILLASRLLSVILLFLTFLPFFLFWYRM